MFKIKKKMYTVKLFIWIENYLLLFYFLYFPYGYLKKKSIYCRNKLFKFSFEEVLPFICFMLIVI